MRPGGKSITLKKGTLSGAGNYKARGKKIQGSREEEKKGRQREEGEMRWKKGMVKKSEGRREWSEGGIRGVSVR